MQIRYSQNFINGLLGIGGLNFFIGLASFVTTSPAWFLFIVGAVLLLIAFYLRNRPLLLIEENRVVVPGLIKPLTRTYAIDSQDDIVLEKSALYVRQGRMLVRIPVAKGMIDPADWRQLTASYEQEQEQV